ncbi:hypothetical protein BZA70DRAFT_275688 [Myxozyma melibiosi]|uniref:Carbohydrate esterase family 16 protein n=1 Tax=Myxozyma melibiosi TaxID=54550 RepID=A0ABR1F8J4_9ASCO
MNPTTSFSKTALVSVFLSFIACGLADQTFFNFGDSYTSTAFSIHSTLPSSNNPFGNPSFDSSYATNGINWLKYLGADFNSSSYIFYNLAVAGATIDNNVTYVREKYDSFVLQVSNTFLPYLAPGRVGAENSNTQYVSWDPDSTTATIWFGINDVLTTYQSHPTSASRVSLYASMMVSYWSAVETLYASGLRRFVIMTVPALDRKPNLTAAQRAVAKAAIEEYNLLLTSHARRFASNHAGDGVALAVVDMYPVLDYVVSNYKTLGFDVQDEYCQAYISGVPFADTWYTACPYPASKYVFINSVHVTSGVHKLFAEYVAVQLEAALGLPVGGTNDEQAQASAFAADVSSSASVSATASTATTTVTAVAMYVEQEVEEDSASETTTSITAAATTALDVAELVKPYGLIRVGES